MTSIKTPKVSDKKLESAKHRRGNFYSQTVDENNTRLNNKTMPDDIRDELKFLQSELLIRQGDVYKASQE